jgi:hypothetical protein
MGRADSVQSFNPRSISPSGAFLRSQDWTYRPAREGACRAIETSNSSPGATEPTEAQGLLARVDEPPTGQRTVEGGRATGPFLSSVDIQLGFEKSKRGAS